MAAFPLPLDRMSLSFQPSEFVKLALVLYLADVMVRHQQRMGDWRTGLLPRLLVLGAVQVLIVLQPDLGTAIAIGLISIIMLWLGGAGAWHLAAAAGAVVPFVAWSLISSPYQMQRLTSFLQGADPRGAGFQVSQSLLALGSGGFLGVGLGDSVQKYFLPEPHTDFVFAFIGEELGLAGSLSVIALFAAIAIHGYRIASDARTYHGFLVAAGITVMISVYAVINVGVVTGILPTTGLPLPLVSYGGSSLAVESQRHRDSRCGLPGDRSVTPIPRPCKKPTLVRGDAATAAAVENRAALSGNAGCCRCWPVALR